MNVRRTLLLFGLAMLMAAPAYARPSVRRTIELSNALRRTTDRLIDLTQETGSRYTRRHLEAIYDLASDVESAARDRDIRAAEGAVNDIVDEVIEMRRYVRNIPNERAKRTIRRDIARRVNDLGREVFEGGWIQVYALRVEDGSAEGGDQDELESLRRGRSSGQGFSEGGDDEDEGDDGDDFGQPPPLDDEDGDDGFGRGPRGGRGDRDDEDDGFEEDRFDEDEGEERDDEDRGIRFRLRGGPSIELNRGKIQLRRDNDDE